MPMPYTPFLSTKTLILASSMATTVLKHNAIFRHSFRIRNQFNGSAENLYGRPAQQSRVTLTNINQKFKKQIPITMTTAYDYSSAVHVDAAGIDICLVGDSASMVVHGHDNTLPITLDDIIGHCRAVRRAATHPFIVGDLPFGSYETTPQQAVDSSMRIMKEGGVDAIKLEGASHSRIAAAKEIVGAGIAVMGHVGLTPQSISVLGGFKAQGRNTSSAVKVVENAVALQEAGCFAVILECVPAPVAAAATSVLKIPTIGIGAGPFCSGQVLVYHDLLGMLQHPHHAKVTPKFCKQYAQVGAIITNALIEYKEEVIKGSFPGSLYSPYKINESYLDGFLNELKIMGFDKAAEAAAEAVQKMENEHQQQLHNLEIGVVA